MFRKIESEWFILWSLDKQNSTFQMIGDIFFCAPLWWDLLLFQPLSFLFFQPSNSHICQTLQLNQKVLFSLEYYFFDELYKHLCFVNCIFIVAPYWMHCYSKTSYDRGHLYSKSIFQYNSFWYSFNWSHIECLRSMIQNIARKEESDPQKESLCYSFFRKKYQIPVLSKVFGRRSLCTCVIVYFCWHTFLQEQSPYFVKNKFQILVLSKVCERSSLWTKLKSPLCVTGFAPLVHNKLT